MEGVITYYKVSLIIFEECYERLKETRSLNEFSTVLKEFFKNYSQKQIEQFSYKLNKIFMNVSLINKLRISVTKKEYKMYNQQKQSNKLWFCGDSPICFLEVNNNQPKDENQIYKSEDILSNLKYDYFNPWLRKDEESSLFTKKSRKNGKYPSKLFRSVNYEEDQQNTDFLAELDQRNKNFLNLKRQENEIVICRKEHICEFRNITLELHKKQSYKKGLFFKQSDD